MRAMAIYLTIFLLSCTNVEKDRQEQQAKSGPAPGFNPSGTWRVVNPPKSCYVSVKYRSGEPSVVTSEPFNCDSFPQDNFPYSTQIQVNYDQNTHSVMVNDAGDERKISLVNLSEGHEGGSAFIPISEQLSPLLDMQNQAPTDCLITTQLNNAVIFPQQEPNAMTYALNFNIIYHPQENRPEACTNWLTALGNHLRGGSASPVYSFLNQLQVIDMSRIAEIEVISNSFHFEALRM